MRSLTQHLVLFVITSFVTLAGALAQTQSEFTIKGSVSGSTGKHTVYVLLWNEAGFLQRPAQVVKIKPGAPTSYSFHLAKGRWVVSAFEDRNENGILDLGLFGPKEPTGFWPVFRGKHKPRFEEIAAPVEQDLDAGAIAIK